MAREPHGKSRPTVRPLTPADVPFVFDYWLNTWRKSRYAGVVRNCDYYEATRNVIEDLLGRGARVFVAELAGALLGFVCGEVKDGRTVLHYLHVKDAFVDRFGIEDALLNALPGDKPGFMTFFNPRFSSWRHAPEIARRKDL